MIELQTARPLAGSGIGRMVGTRSIARRRCAPALARQILKRFAASAPGKLNPLLVAGLLLVNIPLVGGLKLRHAVLG